MSRAIETCKRNELWSLIKKVSAHHGGDDIEELKALAKGVVENYTLDQALECFRDLAKQCDAVPTVKRVHPTGIEPPREIKYQPPFNKD